MCTPSGANQCAAPNVELGVAMTRVCCDCTSEFIVFPPWFSHEVANLRAFDFHLIRHREESYAVVSAMTCTEDGLSANGTVDWRSPEIQRLAASTFLGSAGPRRDNEGLFGT